MGKNKHNYKGSIPQKTSKGAGGIPRPEVPVAKSTNNDKVVFSFEYFDSNAECASRWKPEEVKALFSMFNKVSQRTWQQVIQSGGKNGNKIGLGFTPFEKDPFKRPPQVSKDLCISELRVNQKARVFGCRFEGLFFVIRLDREHSVCPT